MIASQIRKSLGATFFLGFLILIPSLSYGAITFSFDYTGATTFQGNQAARDAVDAAANIVSNVVAGNTTINMSVSESNDPGSSTLASASSAPRPTATSNSFANRGVVGTKILGGGDLNLADADGEIDVNFGVNWSFDNTVGGTQFDFISTMAHELLHAVGFDGAIFSADASNVVNNQWGPYDQFIADSVGALIDPMTFDIFSADFEDAAIARANGGLLADGLVFNGLNATAANGGSPVPLHSSSDPYSPGSSVYHLEDEFFTGSNSQLMNASTEPGLGVRTISNIERGMLMDLGFTLVAVPEPGSFLAIACLSIAGVLRRKR